MNNGKGPTVAQILKHRQNILANAVAPPRGHSNVGYKAAEQRAMLKSSTVLSHIEWYFWKAMPKVKLWQACGLIVGLDPDTLMLHPDSSMNGAWAAPVFDTRCFPSLYVQARFDKALRLAAAAVSDMDGPIFPKGQPHLGNNEQKDVLLSEVVAFFHSCKWPDIPEPMQPQAAPFPAVTTPEPLATTPAPVAADGASGGVEPYKAGPAWSPKASILRAPGYRWPLYQLVKAAHITGKPCPKPRDVLAIWILNLPPDIQVMTDGVKYNDGMGNPREANLKAIGQAIKGLLNKEAVQAPSRPNKGRIGRTT